MTTPVASTKAIEAYTVATIKPKAKTTAIVNPNALNNIIFEVA